MSVFCLQKYLNVDNTDVQVTLHDKLGLHLDCAEIIHGGAHAGTCKNRENGHVISMFSFVLCDLMC